LQGKGDENEYGGRFRFLVRSEPVEQYDNVVTSGHDKVFPPDLVVGYVSNTDVRQDGLYYEYDIAPAVNFSTLEEVLILADDPDELPAQPAGPAGAPAPASGTKGGAK
jgi:rod shape-determining protein MreC